MPLIYNETVDFSGAVAGKNAGRAWASVRWEHIFALIFWFFLIKQKEQIEKLRAAPAWKNAKRKPPKAAHIAFFTGQRSDHVFKEAGQKKAKNFKDINK